MSNANIKENDFLNKITGLIEANISNEQFGVTELAKEVGMSRSNLLRKVKKATNLSVSQFIRQIRLQNAKELLKNSDINVSEVSYAVGFGSTSYFTKCFRDFYGYPPGEIGKMDQENDDLAQKSKQGKKKKIALIATVFFIIIICSILYFFVFPESDKISNEEKSIAVLPFKNDSEDIANVYIVNGLMESVLNNLQKIEDLRVISRTSVEKYRKDPKTIPEIANELNVGYIVEGSGQKIDDKILLNIQLIDAKTDKHLWSEQFERNTSDIFDLQKEVAKTIADKIQVIVTPEEEERIDKAPTDNLIAYDYFLKGYEQINSGTSEGLEASIESFKNAIEHDEKFARAYAGIAMAYYYLDAFQTEKKYRDEINYYADKALFYDDKLAQSLIAKSLYYSSTGDCKLAVPYLEKALEYNPNSALAMNFLSDIYTGCLPNTEKYLQNAVKGLQLNIAASDSATTSINYLHLSNAFIQTGFVDEAEFYINKSLAYNPNNLFSEYVKAYIILARDMDLEKGKKAISATLEKDTTRLDVLQELGKICYLLRDYETAYKYFKKFSDIRTQYNLDIYKHIDAHIGFVYEEMGFIEESKKYFNDYKNYVDTNTSIYKNLELAMYYAYYNDKEKSIEHFKLFSQEDDYHYWIILFLEMDPLWQNVKDDPEFQKVFDTIESKFWKNHNRIRKTLQQKKII